MKIGKLLNVNSKGQIVIPQEYRDLFGIDESVTLNIMPKSTGLFIQPISKVLPNVSSEDVYAEVLKKTTGSWRDEDLDKISKKRRKLELKASARRKEAW